jgi:hypothetical protein
MKFGAHRTSHLTSISHLTTKPTHDASRHPDGGGGGKMPVRYTERRKRGLVATSKNMMAEGMTLHAAASELHVTPPAEKLIQNPLRKTKPPCHPPAVSAQTPAHTD